MRGCLMRRSAFQARFPLAVMVIVVAALPAVPSLALERGLRELFNRDWSQPTQDDLAWDRQGSSAHAGDFNGDGFADLVVGVPAGEAIPTAADSSGVVHVLFGAAQGGDLFADFQTWWQGPSGIATDPEYGDRFGTVLASGFFNDDPYEDLVVGVPNEDYDVVWWLPGQEDDVGVVHVILGTSAGMTVDGSQMWRQGAGGLGEEGEFADRFGQTLAVGDFDHNGYDDLAIGTPDEDGPDDNSGVVQVLYAADDGSGLSATGTDRWYQDHLGQDTEPGDRLGWSMAVGDFDNDGCEDLVVGVPFEDLGGTVDEGLFHVLYGQEGSGLAPSTEYWTQDYPVFLDEAEAGDRFAASLAAGDFNGDGYADLAVGAPGEDTKAGVDIGVVHVLFGSASGLTGTVAPQRWSQGSFGSAESEEPEDRFGEQLIAADFDGDGFDDLAIGVPGEDLDSVVDAGVVHVLYGSAAGLSALRHRVWSHDVPCLDDTSEQGEAFGASLAAGDFDGNGSADLAVGAPDQDSGSFENAGLISILFSNLFVAGEFDGDADGDLDGVDLVQLIDEWVTVGMSDEAPFEAFATVFGRFVPGFPYPDIDDAGIQDTLVSFAPRVWLNEPTSGVEQPFWPSSVDWAFDQNNPGLERFLLNGQYWLRTVPNLESPSSLLLPLFNGEDPTTSTVPSYAFWARKPTEVCGYPVGNEWIDLVYFFYYPYNRGKLISLVNTVFGNHVGDWEHLTIRLEWRREGFPGTWDWRAVPSLVHLSAHSFGMDYEWETMTRTDGLAPSCYTSDCTHPVVYSARGSHGLWREPGDHIYGIALTTALIDSCAAGTAWDTWQDLEMFDYHDPSANSGHGLGGSTWPLWMGNQFWDPGSTDPSDPAAGPVFRWGNPEGSADSGIDPLRGYYRLEKGPTGPVSKPVWGLTLQ